MGIKWVIFKGNTIRSLKSLARIWKRLSTYIFAAITFIVFLFLLKLFTTGSIYLNLLGSQYLSIGDKFSTIISMFQEAITTIDLVFISFLQAVVIAVLIQVIRLMKSIDTKSTTSTGIVALISIIGLGCPSCGTTIIAPFISVIFASSAPFISDIISSLILVLAILLNIYALRRLGIVYDDYAKNDDSKEK